MARGRQLRLVQSAAADVAGAGVVRGGVRPDLAAAADEPDLRCGAQHRQVRTAHAGRPGAAGCGSIAKAPRGRFPPTIPETPAAYRQIGQPVLIPGDMGRASWVLVGQPGSMEQTFGTCCHGAGRRMSRTAAVKHAEGRRIDQELARQGIIARARSWRGLAEEQPDAYKDVNQVVDVVHRANLAAKVARLRPIGVVKG